MIARAGPTTPTGIGETTRRRYHPPVRTRLAAPDDADAIRAIYNVEVLGSTNTFDMVPRTPAEQAAWLDEHRGVHPAIVAVEGPGVTRGHVGAEGEIVSWQGGDGRVRVKGEIWLARSDASLTVGSRVKVVSRDGLVLRVEDIRPA